MAPPLSTVCHTRKILNRNVATEHAQDVEFYIASSNPKSRHTRHAASHRNRTLLAAHINLQWRKLHASFNDAYVKDILSP